MNRIVGIGFCGQGIGGRLCCAANSNSIAVCVRYRICAVFTGGSKSDIRSQLLIFDGCGFELGSIVSRTRSFVIIAGFDRNRKRTARLYRNDTIFNGTIRSGINCSGAAGTGALGAGNGVGYFDPAVVIVGKGQRARSASVSCFITTGA